MPHRGQRKRSKFGRMPAERVRRRHEVTLDPEQARKVHRRVLAAKARGEKCANFSREIDRCIDEAEGNLRSARHQLRNDLHPLTMQVSFLRGELLAGRRITARDLDAIEDAVAKMVSRLEPPAPAG